MKRYNPFFKEAYERHRTDNTFLSEAIDLHNICEEYATRYEKYLKLGDEKYLYNFYNNISKLFRFVKTGYLKFLEEKIPDDKRRIQELKRKFEKDIEPYKDELFNDAELTFLNGIYGYSSIHEFLKELIKVDKKQ